MADMGAVVVKIDKKLKNDAENVLAKIGITPSGAIQMLYRQIVIHNGIPFDIPTLVKKPAGWDGLTREELNAELWKGIESLNRGEALSAEEVDELLAREFGI